MTETRYIDQPDALDRFVADIGQAPWIAVDTEFMRERTYYPELCLIQVATPDHLACVDPIALGGVGALERLLSDPAVTKVFHAAEQDMDLFFTTTGRVPAPVFDTQKAATLAGHPDGLGYARLVQAMLGVELDKAHTRADWQKRPLAQAAIEYAADDVRYLSQLYPILRADLAERGRLDWLDDDFATLVDPARYRPDPPRAWRRVKGLARLRPGQQQIAASLAEWRELTAMQANRPRRWILKDDILLDLARRSPDSAQGLSQVRGLPPALAERKASDLLDALGKGRAREPVALVQTPARLTADTEALADLLMAVLRARAGAHDVSPATVAGRRDLERLARGERDLALLSGWRQRVAGAALLEVLEGDSAVRIADGSLVVDSASAHRWLNR